MIEPASAIENARQDFERDGFAMIRNFFSTEEVADMAERIRFYVSDLLPHMPANAAFFEDKDDPATLFRLERMHTRYAWSHEFLHGPKMMELAETLLGDRPVPQDAALFGKAPKVGKETPAHQDGYYFMLEPNEAVTLWMPLDPTDEVNGCIRYVAGSHRRGMRRHGRGGVFGFSLGVLDYGDDDRALEISVPAQPGDLIAHHSMVIHRADPNASDRRRWALGLVYFAARAKEDEAAKRAYHEKLQAEWAEEGKL